MLIIYINIYLIRIFLPIECIKSLYNSIIKSNLTQLKKWTKDLNRRLSKEDLQITKHIKILSILLVVNENVACHNKQRMMQLSTFHITAPIMSPEGIQAETNWLPAAQPPATAAPEEVHPEETPGGKTRILASDS